jgi:uncharacterized protein YceK
MRGKPPFRRPLLRVRFIRESIRFSFRVPRGRFQFRVRKPKVGLRPQRRASYQPKATPWVHPPKTTFGALKARFIPPRTSRLKILHSAFPRFSLYTPVPFSQPRAMASRNKSRLFGYLPLLLLLPPLLSGCVITQDVAREAFHGSTTFVSDKIKRVERAFVTPEGNLVILLEGKCAESTTNGPFTMMVALPAEGSNSWALVRREDVRIGRDLAWLQTTNLLPVTIKHPVSVTQRGIPGLGATAGTERVLYPIKEAWANDKFWYVVTAPVPRKCEIVVQDHDITTAHEYPLVLLLPLTAAADTVLLPFEICFMFSFGDRVRPPGEKQ